MCVYPLAAWQPLELANRSACCLRKMSPPKHVGLGLQDVVVFKDYILGALGWLG